MKLLKETTQLKRISKDDKDKYHSYKPFDEVYSSEWTKLKINLYGNKKELSIETNTNNIYEALVVNNIIEESEDSKKYIDELVLTIKNRYELQVSKAWEKYEDVWNIYNMLRDIKIKDSRTWSTEKNNYDILDDEIDSDYLNSTKELELGDFCVQQFIKENDFFKKESTRVYIELLFDSVMIPNPDLKYVLSHCDKDFYKYISLANNYRKETNWRTKKVTYKFKCYLLNSNYREYKLNTFVCEARDKNRELKSLQEAEERRVYEKNIAEYLFIKKYASEDNIITYGLELDDMKHNRRFTELKRWSKLYISVEFKSGDILYFDESITSYNDADGVCQRGFLMVAMYDTEFIEFDLKEKLNKITLCNTEEQNN